MISWQFLAGLLLEALAVALVATAWTSFGWMFYLAGGTVAFFAGAALIAATEAPRSLRILLAIWPLLAFVGAGLVAYGRHLWLLRTTEPALWLIPEGYRGPLAIRYSHAAGTPPAYEGGRRLFRFSSEGIVLTGFSLDTDRASYTFHEPGLRPECYLVDAQGARRRLELIDIGDPEAPRDLLGVIRGGYEHEQARVLGEDAMVCTLGEFSGRLETRDEQVRARVAAAVAAAQGSR
jgi:hypothetical protein